MGNRPPEPRRSPSAPAAPKAAPARAQPTAPLRPPAPPPPTAPPAGPANPLTPLLFHVEQMQRRLEDVGQLANHTERLAVLGTMAAAVAHEINNILTPVKAYAEMALSTPGDRHVVVKALQRAAQGVDRATRIAELVLTCARSRPDGSPTPAVVGVLRAARMAAESLPPDTDRMFPVEIDIDDSLRAAMDEVALEQVLLNLMLNARSAMPAGGLTRVTAGPFQNRAKSALSSSQVQIEVTDSGSGITPERLARIFEPFVTSSGGESRPGHRRTGLGLPICRQLVTQAGGRIEIDSAVGKGTTVRIIVPAAPAAALSAA